MLGQPQSPEFRNNPRNKTATYGTIIEALIFYIIPLFGISRLISCLVQYFETGLLWKVSLKVLNSGIILVKKTATYKTIAHHIRATSRRQIDVVSYFNTIMVNLLCHYYEILIQPSSVHSTFRSVT